MKIVFIGAGNLATHLSQALSKAGHDIVQVYSRTKDAAHVMASKVGASSTNDIKEIVCNADIYIFSVKDDVLPSVIEPLCVGARDALFLHTAGSVSMTVFKGKALRYGVFYPMQSFTKSRELDLSDVPVYIEGDSEATLSTIRLLAESVSKKVRVMDSEKRCKLHLAAVFACNFVNSNSLSFYQFLTRTVLQDMQLMNCFRHHLINLVCYRPILQQFKLTLHHVLVVTHSRTCLSFTGCNVMNLRCCLVYQR